MEVSTPAPWLLLHRSPGYVRSAGRQLRFGLGAFQRVCPAVGNASLRAVDDLPYPMLIYPASFEVEIHNVRVIRKHLIHGLDRCTRTTNIRLLLTLSRQRAIREIGRICVQEVGPDALARYDAQMKPLNHVAALTKQMHKRRVNGDD
jgi:hypothetical protein